MPLYEFACDGCGHEVEVFKPLAEYKKDLPSCCGAIMRRLFRPVGIASDIQPYRSTIDGSMITSRSQHRDHLKRHKCIEVGNDTEALMKLGRGKDVRGDFDVRKELTEATNRVFEKRTKRRS